MGRGKRRNEWKKRIGSKKEHGRAGERADAIEPECRRRLAEIGVRLEVSKSGAPNGHKKPFRHWRFYRRYDKLAYLNWWPTTGRWNTPDKIRGDTAPCDFESVLAIAVNLATGRNGEILT